MKHIINYLFLFLSLSVSVLTSCTQTEPDEPNKEMALRFQARISDSNEPATRGPASSNISYQYYPDNFYLDMITENETEGENKSIHKCRIYRVPEKTSGVLHSFIPDDDENPTVAKDSLIWQSKYNSHSFYAWNLPWLSNDDLDPFVDDTNNKDDYKQTRISFHPDDAMYKTTGEDGESISNYRNLEKFIGAKADEMHYNETGEYINLQFQHLVSKLYLNIRYYENNRYRSIDGLITLEGLPAEGYFVRNGEDRPEVIRNEDSKQVSYDFTSNAESNIYYICPDVDFTKIKYRIISYSSNVTTDKGEFLGDFSALELTRDPLDFWDATHSDPHILYAGEVLTLNITLRQGVGTDVSLTVSGWGTQSPREATSYPNKGLYEKNEWDQINNSFSQTDGTYEGKEDIEEELFQNFGNRETGEYDLFTDIDDVAQRVKMGKRHTLNGMGHTITFSKYYTDNVKYVRISRMRDIYLVGPDGLTLYIDENFNIYRVDASGNLIPTSYSLNPPLDETDYNSYVINFETGEVLFNGRY